MQNPSVAWVILVPDYNQDCFCSTVGHLGIGRSLGINLLFVVGSKDKVVRFWWSNVLMSSGEHDQIFHLDSCVNCVHLWTLCFEFLHLTCTALSFYQITWYPSWFPSWLWSGRWRLPQCYCGAWGGGGSKAPIQGSVPRPRHPWHLRLRTTTPFTTVSAWPVNSSTTSKTPLRKTHQATTTSSITITTSTRTRTQSMLKSKNQILGASPMKMRWVSDSRRHGSLEHHQHTHW